MNKKPKKVTISTKNIVLITAIVFALGIFLLFLNILLRAPSDSKKVPDPIVVVEKEPPAKQKESLAEKKEPVIEQKKEIITIIPQDMEKEESVKPVIKEEPKEPVVPVVPKKLVIEKTKDGVLVFVFDDGGHNISHSKPFVNLPFPVTIAVLPQLADSVETAALVRNSGNELFLHQPMQAMNLDIEPGAGAVLPSTTTGEAASIVRKNIAEIGPIKGMNNHEGSLISTDRHLMSAVLDVCIDTGIVYLDSRTTSQTVVPMVALEKDVSILERDIFLDNERDKASMREMIEKGLAIADKKGYAIMIGHVTTPALAELLDEMYSDLSAMGYTFTTPSKLKI